MNFGGRLLLRRFTSLLCRQNFAEECENVLNKQINMELQACHNYLAMAFHFDRCDVAYPGVFKFFMGSSKEERDHAILIMEYMNKRGGNIVVGALEDPRMEFSSTRDAFMEALNMEKNVNQSLLEAHEVAAKFNDPNMCDFLTTNFLKEQVDAIKHLSTFIKIIERTECEPGHYLIDKYLARTQGMHN